MSKIWAGILAGVACTEEAYEVCPFQCEELARLALLPPFLFAFTVVASTVSV